MLNQNYIAQNYFINEYKKIMTKKVQKIGKQKMNIQLLKLRKFKQVNRIGKKLFSRKKKLQIAIISKIKKRSNKNNIFNEISKDIEEVKLKPEELILLDFINKKISNS